MSQYLTPHQGYAARLWFALRANRSFRYKVLAGLAAVLALAGHGLHLFGREALVRVAATSVTPITSLTAGTTGAILVSADRIDLWARTTTGSATLNLVEYNPDDAKWAKVGADCAVTTDLTQCRYVAKRGARYWHVYKASGSMAYVGIEQAYNQGASLGSIEPSGPGISLPLGVSDGGTGLTGFTANRLLYSSSTSAIGQLGCSDGQVPTWSSGAIVCATPASNGNCTILATVWDGGITTAGKFPSFDGVAAVGAATAGSAMRRVLPAGSTWKIRAAITGAPGSGNTVKFEIQTSASLGGTFSADAASAVTFTHSDGANAIKTGSTFTVGGSAVIATIRAIATGADYVSPNQASVQLDCG